jgi:predicted N-formylglutamate amidohydrolase
LEVPLVTGRVTRLVVDLNRSIGHPHLHSAYVAALGAEERRRLVERYYLPYRQAVEAACAARMARGTRVLHLAVHSFTPVLRGHHRNASLGLLYDPKRPAERRLAVRWQSILQELSPDLQVRRNYPYRGTDDGLIPFLRKRFPVGRYLGLELEVNQRHLRSPSGIRQMARLVGESLRILQSESAQ